jgi:hypothetical protein
MMVTDAELYRHMLEVAKAAGFESITEAIATAGKYRKALVEIQNGDPVDMALDPGWARRIAAEALGEEQEKA